MTSQIREVKYIGNCVTLNSKILLQSKPIVIGSLFVCVCTCLVCVCVPTVCVRVCVYMLRHEVSLGKKSEYYPIKFRLIH